MLKTIKISAMFLVLFLLASNASYAFDDQHGHGDRSHNEHGSHAHANPGLVLVTGMDTIDSRVLIAGPDQTVDVEDQSAPEDAVTTPTQSISLGTDGNVIVNVPNNAGGYTPVRIEKWGAGYMGPRGELYYPFPAVSQLKAMYGM